MEPISKGMSGAAVEDVQDRLSSLGFEISQDERDACEFGDTTLAAVAAFRAEHKLDPGVDVDDATWSVLVDECYSMGDRTLYLRLPNFHGRDVRELQNALNILGFSCGSTDGYYDPHTEAAVRQFQDSVGLLADGLAFSDTFDAIDRLHHVWAGKPAEGPHPTGDIGFARASRVLEATPISITAQDPISRNVAGRVWNLAFATSDVSKLALVESTSDARENDRCLFVLSSGTGDTRSRTPKVVLEDLETLPQRIRTAYESSREKIPTVRIELPSNIDYDGTFTTRDAQALAVMLLDGICAAFGD